jgi:hypothetical protein
MSSTAMGNLADTLETLRSRPLLVMRLDVKPLVAIGATPAGSLRIGVVTGGSLWGA